MVRAMFLLLLVTTAIYGQGTAPQEPIPICDVLRHPANYMEKFVLIRGAVVGHQHGAYLVSKKRCRGAEWTGVRLETYEPMYIGKNVKVAAVVEGRLSVSHRRLPRSKLGSHPVFVLRKIDLKESPPDDVRHEQ